VRQAVKHEIKTSVLKELRETVIKDYHKEIIFMIKEAAPKIIEDLYKTVDEALNSRKRTNNT